MFRALGRRASFFCRCRFALCSLLLLGAVFCGGGETETPALLPGRLEGIPKVIGALGQGFDLLERGREGEWRWMVRREGQIHLWIGETARRPVRVRGEVQPYAGLPLPQPLELLLDGEPVGTVPLELRWNRVTWRLPSRLLTVGWHRITFRAQDAASPRESRGEGDPRSLSVRWRRLEIGGDGSILKRVVGGEWGMKSRWAAWRGGIRPSVPAVPGTRWRWELARVAGSRFRMTTGGLTGSPVELVLRWAGEECAREVFRIRPPPGGGWEEIDVALPKDCGASGVLSLEILGDPSSLMAVSGSVVVFPERLARKPDILLVSLDTVRAGYLGAYGDPDAWTPNLDRLFRRGTQYADVVTASPWTLPSHGSLMLGSRPMVHGIGFQQGAIPETAETLAKIFSRAGYRTVGISGAEILNFQYGFQVGFDLYHEFIAGPGSGQEPLSFALDELGRRSHQPLFLFVHLFEAHQPYAPPPEFRRQFGASRKTLPEPWYSDEMAVPLTRELLDEWRRRYRGELATLDRQVGRLVEAMEKARTGRPYRIALVSDHGELFGEHDGAIAHAFYLHQELIGGALATYSSRVQSMEGESRRLEAGLREPRGLFSTLLRWAEIALPSGAPPPLEAGPVELAVSEERSGPVHLIAGQKGFSRPVFAVRDRWKKLILGPEGRPRVCDLASDPGELNCQEPRGEAEQRLLHWLEGYAAGASVPGKGADWAASQEQLDALRSVGYLSE